MLYFLEWRLSADNRDNQGGRVCTQGTSSPRKTHRLGPASHPSAALALSAASLAAALAASVALQPHPACQKRACSSHAAADSLSPYPLRSHSDPGGARRRPGHAPADRR
jgi:hypothetical protein